MTDKENTSDQDEPEKPELSEKPTRTPSLPSEADFVHDPNFVHDVNPLTPRDIFQWGKIIVYIALIAYIILAGIGFFVPENSELYNPRFLEQAMTFLGTVITLILGYYFGRRAK